MVLAVDDAISVIALAGKIDISHYIIDVDAAFHLGVKVCATSPFHLW